MPEIRVMNVPVALKIQLEVAAAEEQMNRNDLYIRAFREWLAARKPSKLPK